MKFLQKTVNKAHFSEFVTSQKSYTAPAQGSGQLGHRGHSKIVVSALATRAVTGTFQTKDEKAATVHTHCMNLACASTCCTRVQPGADNPDGQLCGEHMLSSLFTMKFC